MDKKQFDEMTQAKNDALDAALELLSNSFDTVQILCDDTLPAEEQFPVPRTLDYRRGFGNHNARVWLASKFALRDAVEQIVLVGKQSLERQGKRDPKRHGE